MVCRLGTDESKGSLYGLDKLMHYADIGIISKWSEESFKNYKITINNNTFPRYLVSIKAVVEAEKLFCQGT